MKEKTNDDGCLGCAVLLLCLVYNFVFMTIVQALEIIKPGVFLEAWNVIWK